MTANTYGRQVILSLTNKSGGGVIAGDVVVVDTTNNDAFTTNTAGNFTGVVGIAQGTIANNIAGLVLVSGYAALVNVNASVTRGHYGSTYTVAKQATDAGASRILGTFCEFLTGGTTPDAHLFGVVDLGTGSGNYTSGIIWSSGTSMPGSPATNQRITRTDLGLDAYYDGTRWLTTQLFVESWGAGDATLPFGANLTGGRNTTYVGDYDMWIVKFYTLTYVNTTNDGSHFWTVNMDRVVGANLATFTTASDTHDVFTNHNVAVGALVGSSEKGISLNVAKTSTPGSIYVGAHYTYRLVLT